MPKSSSGPVLGLNGLLDLVEAVDRHVRIQLAGDDDVLAVGRHIGAVGALGLGRQIEDALLDRGGDANDRHAVDHLCLAGGDHLCSLLPVEDMQVVHITLADAGLEVGLAFHITASGQFGVERVAEAPAFADQLAGITQVLPVRWNLDAEGLRRIDTALFAIELPQRDHGRGTFPCTRIAAHTRSPMVWRTECPG